LKNSQVYDDVFKCLPSDNILNFDDLSKYVSDNSLAKTNPILV
jgi:hypothetical protein